MDAAFTLPGSLQIACKQNKSVYKSNRPAWGILTWPKVGEFNLANGETSDLALGFTALETRMIAQLCKRVAAQRQAQTLEIFNRVLPLGGS